MNKFEIRTANKKEAIIRASLRLFNQNGFAHTSIQDIAKEASVSQTSIYNYFDNKNNLIFECVHFVLNDIISEAEKILEETLPFEAKITKAFNLCNNGIAQRLNGNFSQILLEDKTIYHSLLKSINTLKRDIYQKYITHGKQEKMIDSKLSTDTILDLLDAMNSLEYSGSPAFLAKKADELKHLFLFGILS